MKKTYVRKHFKSCSGRKVQYRIFPRGQYTRQAIMLGYNQPLIRKKPVNEHMYTKHPQTHISFNVLETEKQRFKGRSKGVFSLHHDADVIFKCSIMCVY